MPTLSFKDRGAAVLIAHAKAIGVDRVVQDSSGNAGNSVAAYCGRVGIACDIFVPEGTSDKKIRMIEAHGATAHIIPGNRDHCADVCRATAREKQLYYANHVYNPFFYEGTKTYIYETYEQLHRIPEHIFIPVGNGTLFLGIVKGLEHLLQSGLIPHMPQLYLVQSERCQPCSRLWRNMLRRFAREHLLQHWPKGFPLACPCAVPRSCPMCTAIMSRAWRSRKKRSCLRAASWHGEAFTVSIRQPPSMPGMRRTARSMARSPMC